VGWLEVLAVAGGGGVWFEMLGLVEGLTRGKEGDLGGGKACNQRGGSQAFAEVGEGGLWMGMRRGRV
jgi:hypothetical protein